MAKGRKHGMVGPIAHRHRGAIPPAGWFSLPWAVQIDARTEAAVGSRRMRRALGGHEAKRPQRRHSDSFKD